MSATPLPYHLDSVLKSGREAQARRQCSSISEYIIPDEVPTFTSDSKKKRPYLWHKRESHESSSESGDDCDRPLAPKPSRRPSTILHAFERFRHNQSQDQGPSNQCKNEVRESGTQTDPNTRLSPMRRDSLRQKIQALFAENKRSLQSRRPYPQAMICSEIPITLEDLQRSDPIRPEDTELGTQYMHEALNPSEDDPMSTGDSGFKMISLGRRTRSIGSSSWRSDSSHHELAEQSSATAETDAVDSQRWRNLNGYSPPPTLKRDRMSQMTPEKLVNFRNFLRPRHSKTKRRSKPVARTMELTMTAGALQYTYPRAKSGFREARMESLYQLGVLPPGPSGSSPKKSRRTSCAWSKATDPWMELLRTGPSHSPSQPQSCTRARSPSSSQAADIDSDSERTSIVDAERTERVRVAFAGLSTFPSSPTPCILEPEQADLASHSSGVSGNRLSYPASTADDASTHPRLNLKRSAACMAQSAVLSDEATEAPSEDESDGELVQHAYDVGDDAQQELRRVVLQDSEYDELFSECLQRPFDNASEPTREVKQQELHKSASSSNAPTTQQVGLEGLEGLEGHEFVQRILAWTAQREDAVRGAAAAEAEERERGRSMSRR